MVKAHDSIRREAPAAQDELKYLQALKVGEVRKGFLFPALSVGMEWVCTKAEATVWEFDGLFFGQPMLKATILSTPDELILDVRDA